MRCKVNNIFLILQNKEENLFRKFSPLFYHTFHIRNKDLDNVLSVKLPLEEPGRIVIGQGDLKFHGRGVDGIEIDSVANPFLSVE